jgi:transposase
MSDPWAARPSSRPAPPPGPRRRDPAATRQRWAERLDRLRAAGPAEPPALIPLRVAGPAPAVELVRPGGAVLRFAAGTDPALFAGVARQLGVTPC